MPMRHRGAAAGIARRAAVSPRHLARGSGLADKDQALGIETGLGLEPGLAPAGDVRPIFLIWMYLSWAVVLFGAEIAAAAREWRLVERLSEGSRGAGQRLALALALLYRLRNAARSGTVLKESALTRGLPAGLDQLSSVMQSLKEGGFISRSGGRWFLARDLTAASMEDLLQALDLVLEAGEGWPDGVESIVAAAGEAGSGVKGKSLAALIDKATASEPPDGVARLHPAPQDER